jgi:hypothetical protein
MLTNIFQENIETIRLDANGFSHFYGENQFLFSEITNQQLLIVIANQPPVAIPMEIYNSDNNLEYLKIQYDFGSIGHIITTDFKDYVLLNFLSKEETEVIQPFLAHIEFIPVFLFQMAHLFPIPEMLFLIDVRNQYLNCALLIHEELQFITHFKLNDDTDCLYHIMNICNQYKINPSHLNLYYSNLSNSLVELLQSYFTISKLIKPTKNQNLL